MTLPGSRFFSLLTIALCLLAVLTHIPVQAASSPPAGITVTPARLLFTLSKDATEAKTTITITNNYSSAVQLSAEFKGIDTNAGLLVPTNDIDAPFNQALHASATDIILAPQQVYSLTVQLQNVAALAPGGHYATLVLTQLTTDGQAVGVRSQISVSIFGIKTAGEIQSLSLQSSRTNHWLFHLPTTATLIYKNSGNVHLIPRAAINLQRVNSTEPVIQGVSNAGSLPVFPSKTFKDVTPLIQTQHVWLPTRLLQTVSYRFDGQANPQTVSSYIWYVPPIYGWIVLLLIGGLIWRYRHRFKHLPASTLAKPLYLPAWTLTRPHKAIKVESAQSIESVEVATPVNLSAADIPPLKKLKAKRIVATKGKKPTERKP